MVPTRGDVVEDAWIRVEGRVDEADGSLAGIGPLFVDEGDDAAKGRRGRRCAVDQAETAVDRDDIVCAVGRHVGVASCGLRIVVLSRGVGRLVICKIGGNGRRLVGWLGEDVAESTARVDDGLASFLGRGDAGASDNLRRAYGGDIGATEVFESAALPRHRTKWKQQTLYVPSSREGWVESTGSAAVVCPASTFGLGAALTSVSGNAVIARRV